MPFPLGHTAIGLAVYETSSQTSANHSRLASFLMIIFLCNLPDLDVLFGLIFQENGAAYHRGFTHSLVFALIAGWICSQLWRFKHGIPKWPFMLCCALIFSHIMADMLFTATPVSLFWPLELHHTQGHSSWGQVFDMILFQSIRDVSIAIGAFFYIAVRRFFKRAVQDWYPMFLLKRKRAK